MILRSAPLPSSPEQYVLRPFAAGDEAAILALFERCFAVERSLARWEWIYRRNPAGGPWIQLVVAPSGELVGHYAGYPVRFSRFRNGRRERFVALQVGDTMIAPEVRHVGRGPRSLLARAAAAFYARHHGDRVAFSFGFNEGNIRKFSLLFVGAQLVEPCRYLQLAPPRLGRRAALRGRLLSLLGFRVRELARFDERADRLFERVAADYGTLAERRAPYLNWRFAPDPALDYRILALERGDELLGWGVFRRRGERLLWGDALFAREAAGGAAPLLAAALDSSWAAGATSVAAWFPRRPNWWSETLADLGFVEAPEPQDLAMVCVPGAETDPVPTLRHSLYYTWSDSDLF